MLPFIQDSCLISGIERKSTKHFILPILMLKPKKILNGLICQRNLNSLLDREYKSIFVDFRHKIHVMLQKKLNRFLDNQNLFVLNLNNSELSHFVATIDKDERSYSSDNDVETSIQSLRDILRWVLNNSLRTIYNCAIKISKW